MKKLIVILCLLLTACGPSPYTRRGDYWGINLEYLNRNAQIYHNDELNWTCLVIKVDSSIGLSCIPDWQLIPPGE